MRRCQINQAKTGSIHAIAMHIRPGGQGAHPGGLVGGFVGGVTIGLLVH
jgi:hypothetical protein